MKELQDDWDVQTAYKEDPGKAFYLLSSHLLQPEKLSKLICKALTTQVDLQEIVFALVNKGRKNFWQSMVLNRYAIGGLIVTLLFIIGFITKPEWLTAALKIFFGVKL